MDTDAIGKAKSYGKSKGAASSRLLSYEEANELKSKSSSNTKIYAMYRGTANTANAYLNYWLGSARDHYCVWFVNGSSGVLDNLYYNGFHWTLGSDGSLHSDFSVSNGVRPVITVLKSKIS